MRLETPFQNIHWTDFFEIKTKLELHMNVDDTRAFLRENDQRIPSKNWEILEEGLGEEEKTGATRCAQWEERRRGKRRRLKHHGFAPNHGCENQPAILLHPARRRNGQELYRRCQRLPIRLGPHLWRFIQGEYKFCGLLSKDKYKFCGLSPKDIKARPFFFFFPALHSQKAKLKIKKC